MTTRDKTKTVWVKNLPIGGGHPLVVQSMTNTDTRDVNATLAQIQRLTDAGCELVRLAVPDMEAAAAFGLIKKAVSVPLSADIHFDYRLALAAIENGADKLRLNPGNIGSAEKVRAVAVAANKAKIPIRVGVNAGSLDKEILRKYNGITAQGIVESALQQVRCLEESGFYDIIISVKTSDVILSLDAYRLMAEKTDYPLHVGITESGTPYQGAIKSAVGLGAILSLGIGDTIRVSLTGDPVEEVQCAKTILKALELRAFGVNFISCPTCGRTEIDLVGLAQQVENFCNTLNEPLTVAVMGCVVNGPGEAREADFGIAGGKGKGVLFKKGQIIKTLPENQLADALIQEIESYVKGGRA